MQKNRVPVRLLLLCLACAAFLSVPALAAPPADFRDLVKSAMPAVVNISTERTEEVRSLPRMPFDMFRGFPDMERFFEPFEEFYNSPQARKMSSLGSGFIISPDGFIVTNNHVVEGADVIRVNISTRTGKKEETYPAEIVGTDPETDLALLKIKADNLPCLGFGNSDVLEVGEWVVAIGSPLGLDHTVTAGILSAKGRNIQSGSYDDFLQTDASINRGNSGGPLLNMAGEVIGINTAIAQRAQGIGFAIPSSLAKRIISDLQEHKKVSRGWLGVTIQNVDEAAAKALDLPEARGALVNSVLEGQPAAQAGVKGGDVILAVNGEAIADTEHLLRVVALIRPGDKALITLWRDGKEENVSLVVAERDLTQARGKESGKSAAGAPLGLKLRPVSSEDIRNNKLPGDAGLFVIRVEAGSLAEDAGIRSGDILLAVNKQPVHSAEEVSRAIAQAEKQRGAVLLHIVRKGQIFFRAIELNRPRK
jgi:serine protease Do